LPVKDEQPFLVSQAMRDFVEFYAPKALPPALRLRSLIRAIHNSGSLSFRYNPAVTYTARETFEKQEANCLSFAIMVVALAGAAGLRADVNDVDVPLVTTAADNTTLVNYKHVNVKAFIDGSVFKVVDINADLYDMNYAQRRVSRKTAIAQFYNNKGVESMLRGEQLDAYVYFRKALASKPKLSYIWVNLGVLYSKSDKPQLAWAAYERAHKVGDKHSMAIVNMAALYRSLGDDKTAVELQSIAKAKRQSNPYYYYAVARQHYEGGIWRGQKRRCARPSHCTGGRIAFFTCWQKSKRLAAI
jgi:tetratricopeptide (TPR) repeat protein